MKNAQFFLFKFIFFKKIPLQTWTLKKPSLYLITYIQKLIYLVVISGIILDNFMQDPKQDPDPDPDPDLDPK